MRVRAFLSVVLGLALVGGCTSTAGAPSPTSQTTVSSAQPVPSLSSAASSGAGTTVDVEAARAGLARWISAHRPATPTTSTNIPGCPAIALQDVEAALGASGITEKIKDWNTEVEWNEYEDIDPNLIGIVCGGDSDGNSNDTRTGVAVGLAAVDLTGKGTYGGLVEALGIPQTQPSSATALPGGVVQVACEQRFCVALWHGSDGLVLALTLQGEQSLDGPTIAKVMDAVGPQALRALAAL